MPSKPSTLAERIRVARSFTGLSSLRFAEAIGTSPRNLPRWERGHHAPSPRSLRLIADASGVSIEWLTGAVEELHPRVSSLPSRAGTQGSRSDNTASNGRCGSRDEKKG